MSAILDTFLISLNVVLVTLQQGLTIKVFVADQILIGRCFKGFRDIDISKGRQSIVLSAK
jgi:hypothetical protein